MRDVCRAGGEARRRHRYREAVRYGERIELLEFGGPARNKVRLIFFFGIGLLAGDPEAGSARRSGARFAVPPPGL
jgi:hypothetical protein